MTEAKGFQTTYQGLYIRSTSTFKAIYSHNSNVERQVRNEFILSCAVINFKLVIAPSQLRTGRIDLRNGDRQ